MIHSRITAKSQTTIPRAIRLALGLKPGDFIGYEIEGGEVKLKRYNPADPFENPFATFTEWADELDSVYDNL
ncbi:AbrB/MazE/SpoVT family DNA-binding domain-containing protein [Sphingomonas tabacisoli]|uniref:AbrB/MazE/SpoVT family DNA-binding domain-containing protein n=1 Tax=Sphingomonas tabacisoli TaxID=2249466 RepID=A0ABW4HZT1_9SPHN